MVILKKAIICKELLTALESFPRGELLQMPVEQLYETAAGIVSLTLIPRVKVFLRNDSTSNFISCLVFLPEKKFSTETRELIEHIICNKLNAVCFKKICQNRGIIISKTSTYSKNRVQFRKR